MYSIILDFNSQEFISSFGFYEEEVKVAWEKMPKGVFEFEAPITRMIYIEAHNRDDRTWRRFQRDWKVFPWWWFDCKIEEKDVIINDDSIGDKDSKLAGYRLFVVRERNLDIVIYQKATLLFWGRHYLDKDKVELQKSGREKQLIPYFDYAKNKERTGRKLEPWKYIHIWSGQKERRNARISFAQEAGKMLSDFVSPSLPNLTTSSEYIELPFFHVDFIDKISKTYFKIVKFKDSPKPGWWKCVNKDRYYLAFEYVSDFKNRP